MTSILQLPEDEAAWEGMDVMFATRSGGVRRNRLSDFVQINRNGKIAMKLDEGDAIIGVALCHGRRRRAADHGAGPLHPLLGGRRAGVRRPRIRPACAASAWPMATRVISMAILRAVDATPGRARGLSEARQRHARGRQRRRECRA